MGGSSIEERSGRDDGLGGDTRHVLGRRGMLMCDGDVSTILVFHTTIIHHTIDTDTTSQHTTSFSS